VPHAGQAVVHASKAPRRVMACGTRFGKTTVAVHESIYALLAPAEHTRGWLVAPTLDLTQRTFRGIVLAFHTHFENRILGFDERHHRIEVANFGGGRSELRAKSTDKPVSLLGEALDFMVVDEAAKVRDDIWAEHLAPRLLDRNGRALLLSTPHGPGWFYQEFRRGARKRKDPAYDCWQFPTSANPYIAKELIDAEQKRLGGDLFRAQYLAEFIGIELEPCDSCGGPAEGARSFISLKNDERPRTCPECGYYVHEDGKTAVPIWNGRRGTTTVLVVQERAWLTTRNPVTWPSEPRNDSSRVIVTHPGVGDVPLPTKESAQSGDVGPRPACEEEPAAELPD
jgi:hypothetical protein